MRIFDTGVRFPDVDSSCGLEPSLREILVYYYRQAFAADEAAALANKYIAIVGVEAEIARLRAELQNAAKAALDATALACEKEREADALRVDAERRLALIRSTLENSEWRHGSRNIHAELSREVDAAMGEGK
jgi:hypothetical protein